MRTIIGLLAALLLTACGVAERTTCDSENFNMACDALVGKRDGEQDDELKRIRADVDELKRRVSAVESSISTNISNMFSMQQQIDSLLTSSFNADAAILALQAAHTALVSSSAAADASLQAQIDALSAQISALQTQIASNSAGVSAATAAIAALQNTVNVQASTLVQLQLNENITAFHDFCGTKPNSFNEVGMLTSSGKIVVYFESGGSRFLSVLKPGSYTTTDGTSCKFTVNSNGQITNEHY